MGTGLAGFRRVGRIGGQASRKNKAAPTNKIQHRRAGIGVASTERNNEYEHHLVTTYGAKKYP